MTRNEWCREVRQAAENLKSWLYVGNGSHVEREGNCTTTVYHTPSDGLLEAEALIKRATELALAHKPK